MDSDLRGKSWAENVAPRFWFVHSKDCHFSAGDVVISDNPYGGATVQGKVRRKYDLPEPDPRGYECGLDVVELVDGQLPPNAGGNNPI